MAISATMVAVSFEFPFFTVIFLIPTRKVQMYNPFGSKYFHQWFTFELSPAIRQFISSTSFRGREITKSPKLRSTYKL